MGTVFPNLFSLSFPLLSSEENPHCHCNFCSTLQLSKQFLGSIFPHSLVPPPDFPFFSTLPPISDAGAPYTRIRFSNNLFLEFPWPLRPYPIITLETQQRAAVSRLVIVCSPSSGCFSVPRKETGYRGCARFWRFSRRAFLASLSSDDPSLVNFRGVTLAFPIDEPASDTIRHHMEPGFPQEAFPLS